jgi:hypothetical protein
MIFTPYQDNDSNEILSSFLIPMIGMKTFDNISLHLTYKTLA